MPHLYCLTSSATLVFTTGPCMGQMPAATRPTPPTAADPMLCMSSTAVNACPIPQTACVALQKTDLLLPTLWYYTHPTD